MTIRKAYSVKIKKNVDIVSIIVILFASASRKLSLSNAWTLGINKRYQNSTFKQKNIRYIFNYTLQNTIIVSYFTKHINCSIVYNSVKTFFGSKRVNLSRIFTNNIHQINIASLLNPSSVSSVSCFWTFGFTNTVPYPL